MIRKVSICAVFLFAAASSATADPPRNDGLAGLQHDFDPFEQVASRLKALQAVGHPTDKIEMLILGGTWSAYRRDYQEWFVLRCFDAMNGRDAPDLPTAPEWNETAAHRNVGLVIETRPDEITPDELAWLRRLGVTKVQMGAQSFDDRILEMNKRGHDVAATRRAVALLRAGGFKIVLHWMPNLLGATVDSDRADFVRLWEGLCPDEIKIYPTQLLWCSIDCCAPLHLVPRTFILTPAVSKGIFFTRKGMRSLD